MRTSTPTISDDRPEQRPNPYHLRYDYKGLPNRLRKRLERHKKKSKEQRILDDIRYYQQQLEQSTSLDDIKFFQSAIKYLEDEIKENS